MDKNWIYASFILRKHTLETYVAQEDDELTVVTGEKVTIQKKFCDGWWLVKRGNFVGTVPQVSLKAAETRRLAPKRGQSFAKRKRNAVTNIEKLI